MAEDWEARQDRFHQSSELDDSANAAFLAELLEELRNSQKPLLHHDKKGFALSIDAIADFLMTSPEQRKH
ncbi:MAG: hypothetical protein AAGF57_08310 [Pseudomonadota bacterium]